MKRTKANHVPRLVAVCAAVAAVIGLSIGVYAADVGGIQRTIQLWIHGDQTDAVLEIQGGEYTVTYQDEDGVSHALGGGGVAFDLFGNERPLTEEEIMEHLDAPDVEYREDGSVWVCYHDQEIAITDRFDEDGVCYVQIKTDDGPLYLTVKYHNGFSYSNDKYVSPDDFN